MRGQNHMVDVDAALADVTERLVTRFEQQVPHAREAVEETVTVCATRWRDAHVTDFVPLLTERRCRTRLKSLSRGYSV